MTSTNHNFPLYCGVGKAGISIWTETSTGLARIERQLSTIAAGLGALDASIITSSGS